MAREWLKGANQDAAGLPLWFARNIEAVVNSVDEIDVRVAGRAKYNRIAQRTTCGGVRCGIIDTEVRFGLDDAAREEFAVDLSNEGFAQQSAGDFVRWRVIKIARQWRDIYESSGF